MDEYIPTDLGLLNQTATTIKVSWSVSSHILQDIDHFDIRYHPVGTVKWKTIETDHNKNTYTITELKSETPYEFKVRSVLPDGNESPFCDPSVFNTMASLTEKMKKEGKKLTGENIPTIPTLYKIPLEKVSSQKKTKTRKIKLRTNTINPGKKEKTIMIVGATGAGKSTLIDGLMNFYLDVAWDEESRFKLVDLTEEEQKNRNDAESKTEWITCYELPWMPGCQVDFNLNIIDTPGFGDTRGITRDKELVGQITSFFSSSDKHGIDCLDAVWFVTQAPLCRLSPIQRYIFDSVLGIFGNDIGENIFILITFADGQRPPVLDAIEEAGIPHQDTYIFNNSALFVDPDQSPNGKIFWKMGKQGFEDFFKNLNNVTTKSLLLTKEVLETRKQLEDHIACIQKQIIEGTEEQLKMKEEERVLKQHERDIADNKNFEYQVKEHKTVKVDLPTGIHTTTCLNCNFTCHENCIFADDDQKMLCSAMEDRVCIKCLGKSDEKRMKCTCLQNICCRICEQHCIWSAHKNQPYLIKPQEVYVTKTYEEMKKKYESAQSEVGKATNMLERIKEHYDAVMEKNKKLVTEVKHHINRLKDIALKPNPLSELDYISILIENENDGRKDGYKERIHILEELKGNAELWIAIAEELDEQGLDQSTKVPETWRPAKLNPHNKNVSDGIGSVRTKSRNSKLCNVM